MSFAAKACKSSWQTSVVVLGVGLLLSLSSGPSASAQQPAEKKPAAEKKAPADKFAEVEKDVTQGALRMAGKDGGLVECPLEHTDVQADISGFIARVKVTQTFHNPTKEKIEAVYVFPLPHEAAVDDMTMKIGDRKIVGVIKRRDEARRIYEEALQAGQTAALLEQERPNIFTQSVGNIGPGERIDIEISYVDVLKYDMGSYEFHYPMVVGPRYIPGNTPSGPAVPDAERISPPVLRPEQRTGHDVSIAVNLDAGVPIHGLTCANHKVHTIEKGDRAARVRLLQEDSIPNKDFVLRYDVMGEKPEMAVLSHTGEYSKDAKRLGDGYFMLMIQPKEDERLKKSPPREVVFLVDVSGSMSGDPTAKVRGAMKQMLELCREKDTVQVVTFAGQANQLFDRPVPVNEENIGKALAFAEGFRGSGGTEMLKGVTMAMDQPVDKERIRIIVMLTDGYIGNEPQIIEHVGKRCGDRIRFWAVGIGQSPNMFLIDGVARQGGGMGKKLGLKDDTAALTTEVMTRIQRAQLADVNIDWGDLQVVETYPTRLPELWAGRPVIVYGRYAKGGAGRITVSGNVEGEAVQWPLEVTLAARQPEHDVLAKVWARQKIEDLMQSAFYGDSPAVEEEVTALALDYRLMSQYTSFVAVDAESAAESEEPAKPPRRMMVPVPLPEGTQWEGFFGERLEALAVVDESAIPFEKSARGAQRPFVTSVIPVIGGAARSKMPAPGPAAGPAGSYRLSQFGAAPTTGRALKRTSVDGLRRSNRSRQLAANAAGFGYGGGGRGVGGMGGGGFGGYVPISGRAVGNNPLDARKQMADQLGEPRLFASNTQQALYAVGQKLAEAAQQAAKSGQEFEKAGKLDEAQQAFLQATLLDTAAMNLGQSNAQLSAEAMAALETLHEKQVVAWKKRVPALDKRLDLELRDQSLERALKLVGDAAGVKIELVEGSLDDAKSMTGAAPHVHYLDLRRATAAQALDWLLLPERLTWRVGDEKQIVATSARRESGQSAWVYDVSTIALPDQKKLAELKDYAKMVEAAKKQAQQFLEGCRAELKLEADAVHWFAPGQVLLLGDAKTHAAAARLFEQLADPKFKPDGDLAKLHKVTSKRAKERRESLEKLDALRKLYDVAAVHEHFGWKLLADAAADKLDLESLTELQIAWKRGETKKLLEGDGPAVALRSAWILGEASRALPDNAELRVLAAAARQQSRAAVKSALDKLQKEPENAAAFTAALYGTLLLRGDKDVVSRATPLLRNSEKADSPLASARIVAAALLAEPSKIDGQALRKLIDRGGLAGDDMVALTALACRRAGGETWQAFRAASRDLLGGTPLSGSVVVLVSRLSRPQLNVVAER